MLGKSQRTLDAYLKAGAAFRIFNAVGLQMIEDLGVVLSTKDQDMIVSWFNKICCKAITVEENMFRDHPDLSESYRSVFDYGLTPAIILGVDLKTDELKKDIAELLADKKHI